jgi:uncharacterized protein (DUF2062 family)
MRKLFKQVHPQLEAIRHHRWLRPFAGWLHHPDLWHLHRRSVAGGVAVGLFCGLIPGPVQVVSAALFAVLFRVNLPLSALVTAYSNPFTIVPLYVLAYELGSLVLGVANGASPKPPPFPEVSWDNWANALWEWLFALGEPLLFGLPLLAAALAVAGYLLVRLLWRVGVVLRWRARAKRRLHQGGIDKP